MEWAPRFMQGPVALKDLYVPASAVTASGVSVTTTTPPTRASAARPPARR
jgi:hypothetical protein